MAQETEGFAVRPLTEEEGPGTVAAFEKYLEDNSLALNVDKRLTEDGRVEVSAQLMRKVPKAGGGFQA